MKMLDMDGGWDYHSFNRKGTKQMKTLFVFIHTKLMNVDVVLAVPFWQAAYSKVFTSISEDYVAYTPVAFDTL